MDEEKTNLKTKKTVIQIYGQVDSFSYSVQKKKEKKKKKYIRNTTTTNVYMTK